MCVSQCVSVAGGDYMYHWRRPHSVVASQAAIICTAGGAGRESEQRVVSQSVNAVLCKYERQAGRAETMSTY